MIRSVKRWLAWRRTMRLPDLSDAVNTEKLRLAHAVAPAGEVTPPDVPPWRPWETVS